MRPKAIEKACRCLDEARDALDDLGAETSLRNFDRHWSAFLNACSRIYAALEQGAKGSPDSEYWFGLRKHARKADQLLHYLHIARDAEQHGIEPVRDISKGGIGIGRPGEAVHLQSLVFDNGRMTLTVPPGVKPPTVEIIPSRIVLKAATSRGHTAHPPKQHLGNPIREPLPMNVAIAAIAYLNEMIEDASKLAEPDN